MYITINTMKKLSLLLSLVILSGFLSFGQSYKTWSGTYNSQSGDSVLSFIGEDVSGCGWSGTFSYPDVSKDSSFIVDIGGSNIKTDFLNNYYGFQPLNLDSLPYTIDSTTIEDTLKNLWTSEPFPFRLFQMELDVKPTDSSDIDFVFNFFKL